MDSFIQISLHPVTSSAAELCILHLLHFKLYSREAWSLHSAPVAGMNRSICSLLFTRFKQEFFLWNSLDWHITDKYYVLWESQIIWLLSCLVCLFLVACCSSSLQIILTQQKSSPVVFTWVLLSAFSSCYYKRCTWPLYERKGLH